MLAERVEPPFMRLVRRAAEIEARLMVRPLASGVHVAPIRSPRAVVAAEGPTHGSTPHE